MTDVALIKQLRGITHAPLKDCKSALEESNGDLDRAQEILREKGALKAAKKADRETNEGTVCVKQIDWRTVWIKLASETDFVAKSPLFLDIASKAADIYGASWVFDTLDSASDEAKAQADKLLTDNFVTIGENMRIVEAFSLEWNSYIYRHPWDKVAAIVFFEGEEEKAKAAALQAAAMNPQYLSIDEVPSEDVDALKIKFTEELADSDKPDDIKEKIVIWRLQKERREIVLLEQPSIVDDSKSVKQLLWETTISKFIRFAI